MAFYSRPCSFRLILWLIVLVSVVLSVSQCRSLPISPPRAPPPPPCIWQTMISMKAHSHDNTFLIILHPPWGRGLSICALNWPVSQCTPLTLQIKDTYWKVNSQSPPAHSALAKNIGLYVQSTNTITHTERHTCICLDACTTHTDTGINKVYTPCSRNVTGMYMR